MLKTQTEHKPNSVKKRYKIGQSWMQVRTGHESYFSQLEQLVLNTERIVD